MKQIKNKPEKGSLSSLLLILVFLPLFNLSAQNYVGTGGELYSGPLGYNLGTTTDWSTVRSSAPGYYSWANGTNTSSYIGLSATNNVNGYVKKYGADAFVFPIGSGSDMRTLAIAASSGAATDAYATAWIDGDPTTMVDPTNADAKHPITSVSGIIIGVSPVGQWDWQAISGTGAGLGITVSIPAITATGVFNQASNLRLVGWDGSVWKALGTTGATGLANYDTLSGTMVAGIQAIGIGAACSAGINYPTIQ
jgi:hypothetical protein